MKCKHCGKELMDGAKFCVYCGSPIDEEQSVVQQSIPVQSKTESVIQAASIQNTGKPVNQSIQEPNMQSEQPNEKIDIIDILEPEKKEVSQQSEVKIENQANQQLIQPDTANKVVQPAPATINLEEKTINAIKTNEVLQPIEETKKEEPSIIDIVNPVVEDANKIQKTQQEVRIEEQPIQQTIIEPTPIELPKEEPKIESQPEVVTKVVKKNNPILIVIIFILLAIIIGGGIFVYTNYIAKDNKSSSNTTVNTTNETVEQDYDLTKAKELVDKYYFTLTSPEKNLFTEEMTTSQKKYIAVKNLSSNEVQTITCEGLDNFSKDDSGVCRSNDNSSIITQGKMIPYEALNKEYKYLFGKNEEIEKQDFEVLLTTWKYDSAKDVFIDYNKVGGYISGPYFSTYDVQSAKDNGETLTVNAGYIYIEPKEENGNIIISGVIAGEEVKYTEEETKAADFRKNFLDKYLDKLDTYQFTFKYEDDHYVFVDMEKI